MTNIHNYTYVTILQKLVKRRIDWLQERVQFTDCPEVMYKCYLVSRQLYIKRRLTSCNRPTLFSETYTSYILYMQMSVSAQQHIQFTSQTHYGEERELIYSGTLNKVCMKGCQRLEWNEVRHSMYAW